MIDAKYINDVLKGNTIAYGYLIRKYQNKAFGMAVSMVKDEDDAKDIVQESFVTAYSSLHSFRNEAKFSTWLYRIVVNTALQYLKRAKRKEAIMEEYSLTEIEKASYNEAIGQLKNQDLKVLIKKVFAKIPPKEALVLQLFYLDNQSIVEIAEITAFTKANVKVLLHRGRNSFYKMLEEENIYKPY